VAHLLEVPLLLQKVLLPGGSLFDLDTCQTTSVCFMTSLVEVKQSPTVVGVEVRTAPSASKLWVWPFSVMDGGFEVMRLAWPRLDHVFSVRQSDKEGKGEGGPKPTRTLLGPHCMPNDLFNNSPVDILTIKQGFATKPLLSFERDPGKKVDKPN
jgi:hypothetical protein